jgi:hypothetical protein
MNQLAVAEGQIPRRKAPIWAAVVGQNPRPASLLSTDRRKLIVSSREFTEEFVPPDYLVDGVMQRRFLYSLTAPTGAGKTAIALRIAAHVALGLPLGDHPIEKGRVLYFAGENPDDLRMRWIAMAEHMKFDLKVIDVHFVVGTLSISELMETIKTEVQELKGVTLVIVDTSAAYFEGVDENDNVQAGNHARMIRSLTTLPDGPSVLLLSHPPKNAKNESLLPRGGGAFIAEVDGNFVCRKSDALAELYWHGKFRGADFDPIAFQLRTVFADAVKDTKGRPIPTVIAAPLSAEEQDAYDADQVQDKESLLALIRERPGLSLMEMATTLGWKNKKGEFDKKRVQNAMTRLKNSKLVKMDSATNRYTLTKLGETAAEKVEDND